MKTDGKILRSGNISFDIFNKKIRDYKLIRHRFFDYAEAFDERQLRSFYVDLVVTFLDGTKEGIELFVAGKFSKDISEHVVDDIYVEGFITEYIKCRLDEIYCGYKNILPNIQKEVLQYMRDNVKQCK